MTGINWSVDELLTLAALAENIGERILANIYLERALMAETN